MTHHAVSDAAHRKRATKPAFTVQGGWIDITWGRIIGRATTLSTAGKNRERRWLKFALFGANSQSDEIGFEAFSTRADMMDNVERPMRTLEQIIIQNFKSIREQTLDLGALNVFIGANGAGKSNLVEAFRLLREIAHQNLASYSLKRGADRLLHLGLRVSPYIELCLQFGENNRSNAYRIRLVPSDEGALIVDSETVYFHDRAHYGQPYTRLINTSSKEAVLATSPDRIASYVRQDIDSYRVYHFHDTSDTAAIKSAGALEDNRYLRPDASNLAAFLYLLQQQHPVHFRNIEDTVRQIAPFFERFNLAPARLTPDKIRLEWKQKGSDAYFDANSLSDGTLRFMCLTTLLLQPVLPRLILLDEPELGLHPSAIGLLASLLSSASTRTQVIVATQSVTLVNQFGPEVIWTVERDNNQSIFRHLSDHKAGLLRTRHPGGHIQSPKIRA